MVFIFTRTFKKTLWLNRSYRDSETEENVEAEERKQRGGNDRKRTATINITKNENKVR